VRLPDIIPPKTQKAPKEFMEMRKYEVLTDDTYQAHSIPPNKIETKKRFILDS
jgi:predicted esterase